MPAQGTGTLDEEGFARGNADGLFRIRQRIASFAPDVVVVLSADHVYRLDVLDVLATHHEAGAECTVVTSEVPLEEAGDHLVVECDDGRVVAVDDKPDAPRAGTVATELFVYDPAVLVTLLEELHRDLAADSPVGDTGLGDFGDHLLPALVTRGRTVVHRLEGYWRDLGQPHLYLRANLEATTDDLGVLAEPGWAILTRQPQRVPARVLAGGVVEDSLLSPGARVSGTVRHSVLGPGVVVEAGAEVHDSVVFADTVVEAGARVHWSVVDAGCRIGAGAVLSDPAADGAGDPDQVTMVGRGGTVGAGVRLDRGTCLDPGTSA